MPLDESKNKAIKQTVDVKARIHIGMAAVAAIVVLLVWPSTARGQSNAVLVIDAPAAGSTVAQPFTVSGWSIDPAASSGTGVSEVHVYVSQNGTTVLGTVATYGTPRPDIGNLYGPQFENSGFTASIEGVEAGTYQLAVLARRTATGNFDLIASRSFTIPAPPHVLYLAPQFSVRSADGATLAANVSLLRSSFSEGPGVRLGFTSYLHLNMNDWNVDTTSSAGTTTSDAATLTVTATAGVFVNRYRLYSPVTLEHLYTTALNEYNTLGTPQYFGIWQQENLASQIHNGPVTVDGVDALPYYRLYDFVSRWHHWTTDRNEYDTLRQNSFRYIAEGIDGYIFQTQVAGTVPWYRLAHTGIPGLHHWTTDQHERDLLTAPGGGWIEDQKEYVFPP